MGKSFDITLFDGGIEFPKMFSIKVNVLNRSLWLNIH